MNRPTLQPTVFTNHPNGGQTFGFRFYDDEGQTYSNTMSKEDLDLPPLKFLEKARMHFDDVSNSIFDTALENGMFIRDRWFTSEQLSEIN